MVVVVMVVVVVVVAEKSFGAKIDSKIFDRKKLMQLYFFGDLRIGANKKLALNFSVKRPDGWRLAQWGSENCAFSLTQRQKMARAHLCSRLVTHAVEHKPQSTVQW